MMEEGLVNKNLVKVEVARKQHWLPDGNDGKVMYTHAFHQLQCFIDVDTRQYITGLTPEQELHFEKVLNLEKGDLNKYNGKFWAKFTLRISKNGITLDLNNPYDQLVHTWLKHQKFVASSPMEQMEKPWAEYVITSDDESAKLQNVKTNKLKTAIKKAEKFSTQDQMDYLMVLGKKVNKSSSTEFIQSSFDKEIMENPDKFLSTIENMEDYKLHVFVRKCVHKRILTQVGQGYKVTGEDKVVGNSLSETINNLKDPINQEILLSLNVKLDSASKVSV
jgi:hypothetical protein